jgi:tetratricopeptide (TPR) repeat protein
MSRQRHRSSRSQFPVSQPASPKTRVSQLEQNNLQKIQELLEAGETEEVLRQLAIVPGWIKRTQEYSLLRASALMQMGDLDASGSILRELERKQPGFVPLYLPLATWYFMQEWPAHALRTVRKSLESAELDARTRETARIMAGGAQEVLESLADELNLPFEKAEQAGWHNEQAQLALSEDNLAEVERHTRESLRIAPHWSSPRNNLAQALYWMGKCQEALRECENVLASDPSNAHGLNNLATFHAGLGNMEQGYEYANRLYALIKDADRDSLTADLAISALAVVENSTLLWELAQRYLRRHTDALLWYSWQCMGVAAARLGKFKEAKKFLERASSDKNAEEIADLVREIAAAIKAGKVRLVWPPIYPGFEMFLPKRLLSEWMEIVKKIHGDQPSPAQRRRVDTFLARYPFALQAFKRLLWSEKGCMAGTSGLVLANKPEADAEILRFALSDCGDDESRMEATMMLSKAGRYAPEGPVKFWDADKNEWHDVSMFAQQIGEVENKVKPETADLITRSRKTKDPKAAVALLRRAVKDDPTCAMALHNLGTLLLQQGEKDEGEKLMRRSVEIDPAYTFGFANLGFLEAQRENSEAALDLLMHVNQAKVITPDTSVIANLAYMLLAAQEKNIAQARRHFDLASEIRPDHPLLEKFDEWLDELELFSKSFGFLGDYQKQSANRFHRKMLNTSLTEETNLEACLSGLTIDSLVGICRFWKTYVYGKKQEMVTRLAVRIMNVDLFGEITRGLDHEQHEALCWILENNGWRPWEEFNQKFGDDMDESPYWRYHDPESLPGRLKMAGLLFTGTLNGAHVAFIPVDIRWQVAQVLQG